MQPQLPADLLSRIANDGLRIETVEKALVDDAIQVGTVVIWPDGTMPFNYKVPDGSELDRVGYAALFQQYGTQFGVGDGVSTFNLPDYTSGIYVPTLPVWTPLTYQTTWRNYTPGVGAGHTAGAYTKDQNGRVWVRGLVNKSTNDIASDTIAILPAGYRPALEESWATAGAVATAADVFRIVVQSAGNIIPVISGSANNNYITLAPINFDSGSLPAATANNPIQLAVKVL